MFKNKKGKIRMWNHIFKKTLIIALSLSIMTTVFAGCGAKEPAEPETTESTQGVESEITETTESVVDGETIPANYEILELAKDNVSVKVGYDAAKIKGTPYSNWANLMGTEKPISLLSVYLKSFSSVEDYANDALSVYTQNDPEARFSEVDTVAFGDLELKHFTITYNNKVYETDQKLENLSEAEIAGLPYTIEEAKSERYVMEVGEEMLMEFNFSNDNAMKLVEYIAIELN